MGNPKSKGAIAKSLPVDQQGPTTYDPDAGVKAFEALRPALMAIANDEVEKPRIDVEMAGYLALAVAKRVQSDEVRPRFARLPKEDFDMSNVDGLSEAAWASLYALGEAQDEGALATTAKLPAEIAQEATELEQRMQAVCEYHLSDDVEIAPILDRLRPGTGYRDMLNDIKGYARIYERRADVVKSDTKNYRPGDLKRAKELIAVIGEAFVRGMSPSARKAYDLYARCWTLLSRRYDETRQAGLWLFRADSRKDAMFPSLYSVGRPNVGRPRKQADSGTTEIAAPPAEMESPPVADVA